MEKVLAKSPVTEVAGQPVAPAATGEGRLASAPLRMAEAGAESDGEGVSDVLQFEHVHPRDIPAALRDSLNSLTQAWRKDAGAVGENRSFSVGRLQAVPGSGGGSIASFVRSFEEATGKQVVWVDTDKESPLPWRGAVLSDRPNTIFVHQRARGNVLALIGHEWGHTLARQDPKLYRELQRQLAAYLDRPAARRMRKNLRFLADYRRGNLSAEITNNIIGDSFTDADFWRAVEAEDQGLLRRAIKSVMEWFTGLDARLRESDWGTVNVLSDVAAGRQAVAAAFAEAVRRGPYSELQDVVDDAEMARVTGAPLATHALPDGRLLTGPGIHRLSSALLRAYHGTPHEVDMFRTANIGTGEGAQVYGWGLYFAQQPAVAESYRKGLSEKDFIRKVREVYGEFDTPDDAIDVLDEAGLNDGQMRLVRALQADDWLGFDYPHQAVSAALREPENFDLSPESEAAIREVGNTYTVEMDVDDADLLDWDKPLSGQSGKEFYVYEKQGVRGEVWIDVSRLETADGGAGIYAAVGNYAANTGRTFVGDPAGLSEDAVIRRTSAMLSMALRFGRTDFMEPAPEQLAGKPEKGIAPLEWQGNDARKTEALIRTFLATIHNQLPQLKNYRYDFGQAKFIDARGNEVGPERFEAARGLHSARAVRAGEATLRRAILVQSLVSSEGGESPGLLENLQHWNSEDVRRGSLGKVFSTPLTPPSDPAALGSWAETPLRMIGYPEARMNRGTVALARWAGEAAKRGGAAPGLPAVARRLAQTGVGKHLGAAAKIAQQQLLPKTLLPREVAAWMQEARSAIAWSYRASEDIMSAIKSGGAARFEKGFVVPEEGRHPDVQWSMARYFRGEIPVDELPEAVRPWAAKLTSMWDERGRRMVDAGPLLHLHEAGLLDLLEHEEAILTAPVVVEEWRIRTGGKKLPGRVLMEAPGQGALSLAVEWVRLELLDRGEAEALAHAREIGVEGFLTDDTAAREFARTR